MKEAPKDRFNKNALKISLLICFILASIILDSYLFYKNSQLSSQVNSLIGLNSTLIVTQNQLAESQSKLQSNSVQYQNYQSFIDNFFKSIRNVNLASDSGTSGDNHYQSASIAYKSNQFQTVISECTLARSYYSSASQYYKNAKTFFEQTKQFSQDKYKKLLDDYIGACNAGDNIYSNMYEACEHFESAARYYSNNDYTTGTSEIDAMNEKIKQHDSWVQTFNTFFADLNKELSSL